MKIPFDIKFKPQIESGEYKVETRDGHPARIICWDANCYTPIVFLATEHDDLDDKDKEYPYSCNNFGRSFSVDSPNDLFIITPEPELSEFEKKLYDVVGYAISLSITEPQKPTSEFVKEYAAELLELAKNEIYSHKSLVEYAETAREEGKSEALKDLPRWYKCAPRDIDDDTPPAWIVRFDVEREGNESKIVHNGYYIDFGSLERLPGFNE